MKPLKPETKARILQERTSALASLRCGVCRRAGWFGRLDGKRALGALVWLCRVYPGPLLPEW